MKQETFGEFLKALDIDVNDIIDLSGTEVGHKSSGKTLSLDEVMATQRGSFKKVKINRKRKCGHVGQQCLDSVVTEIKTIADGKKLHGNSGCKECSKISNAMPEFFAESVLPVNDPELAAALTVQGKNVAFFKCQNCGNHVEKRPQDVLKPVGGSYEIREFCHCVQPTLGDNKRLVSEIDRSKYSEEQYQQLLGWPLFRNDYVHWRCDMGHQYKALLSNRANGSGCPEGSNQTSRLELVIHAVINTLVLSNSARLREVVEMDESGGMKRGEIDVMVTDGDSRMAIEIDGPKHYNKEAADRDRKKNESYESRYGLQILRVRYPASDEIEKKFAVKISKFDLLLDSKQASIKAVVADTIKFFDHILELAKNGQYEFGNEFLKRLVAARSDVEWEGKIEELANDVIRNAQCSVDPSKSIRELRPDLADMFDAAGNMNGSHKIKASQVLLGTSIEYHFRCLSCDGLEKISPLRLKIRPSNCVVCSGRRVTKNNNILSNVSKSSDILFDCRNNLSYEGAAISRVDFDQLSDSEKASCTLIIEIGGIKRVTKLADIRLTSNAKAYRLGGKGGLVVIRDVTRTRKGRKN